MPFLWPRIREKDKDLADGAGRNQLAKYRDDVVIDNTNIAYVLITHLVQQVANTGTVHLDGKVIIVGMLQGMLQGTVTCANANIHYQRCPTPE